MIVKINEIVSQLNPETKIKYRMLCAIHGKGIFDKKLRSYLENKIGGEQKKKEDDWILNE